jgi:hypothetical protein
MYVEKTILKGGIWFTFRNECLKEPLSRITGITECIFGDEFDVRVRDTDWVFHTDVLIRALWSAWIVFSIHVHSLLFVHIPSSLPYHPLQKQ